MQTLKFAPVNQEFNGRFGKLYTLSYEKHVPNEEPFRVERRVTAGYIEFFAQCTAADQRVRNLTVCDKTGDITRNFIR